MTKAEEAEQPVDFEQALAELEALVERMESGELSLEDSLKSFERGIALTRQCQKALSEAEQKVEILTGKNGEDGVEPFTADNRD
ncbi:exodeoxyribonuclease VII small subunit [Methylonatrum kenyense]|uniref:exodeoxyribonuclease VII small subunit n=1 Tax=Methylonatrum kenyense TaxID=455253 RepID=UPI0020BF7767|nr:exodeoxyribonuclease VII small subunit [Methylonatrum kenyense]MCK8517244.1 exodeoxyribonuclease VII small subunit [Methylonatrum kenyense]